MLIIMFDIETLKKKSICADFYDVRTKLIRDTS